MTLIIGMKTFSNGFLCMVQTLNPPLLKFDNYSPDVLFLVTSQVRQTDRNNVELLTYVKGRITMCMLLYGAEYDYPIIYNHQNKFFVIISLKAGSVDL